MAVAQAMAAGRPVGATRVGGIPWMLDNEVTRYLVDVVDTATMASRVMRLLCDKSMRQRIGQAAHKAAKERFSEKMVAEQTVQAYRDLLGR